MSERIDKLQLLKSTLEELEIGYTVRTLISGRVMLSIEDIDGSLVEFVFIRHGDEIGDLSYWEVWKA